MIGPSLTTEAAEIEMTSGRFCAFAAPERQLLAVDGHVTARLYRCSDHDGAIVAALRSGVAACIGASVRVCVNDVGEETLAHDIANVILPLAVSRRHLVLHGATIERAGTALVVVAPSGTGKSTLAEAAHSLGYQVLSDDTCAVFQHNGNWRVAPGAPVITPRRTDGTRSRIDLDTVEMRPALSAICVAHRGIDAACPRSTPGQGAVALMANSFVLDHSPPSLRAWAGRAAALSRSTPVHSLTIPEGLDRIPDVFLHLDRLLS